jgi:hypothetical protein
MSQGLQWRHVIVDATGMERWSHAVYTALSRVTNLEGLRLEGVKDREDFTKKVQPHFKAVLMLHAMGVDLPHEKVDAAWKSLDEHEKEWAAIRAHPAWPAWERAKRARRA